MAFKMSTQKVTGTVNVVEIGTGDKAIKLGGEQVLPFYSFDGETGNAPVVGAEISDIQPAEWIDCYSKYMETFGQTLLNGLNMLKITLKQILYA